MYILGSGLAGCLAAIHFPNARVIERNEGPTRNHFALLRMRTDAISQMTGIPFKKVEVDKWVSRCGKTSREASLSDIIQYAQKTNKVITKRSIHDIKTEVRYIPPDDLHMQLLDRIDGRVKYGQEVVRIESGAMWTKYDALEVGDEPIISTLPIKVNADICSIPFKESIRTDSRSIFVSHYTLHGYDLYSTIYFPGSETSVYRASISGSTLILESMLPITEHDEDAVMDTLRCSVFTKDISNVEQPIGKLVPIDDDYRKGIIYSLTVTRNLYSLGRFACWRQILLDDVVKDIAKIHRMITIHPYDRSL